MTLRFGTDGVRGVANAELTPELVLSLGRTAAVALGSPQVLVGRDTRASGSLLSAALSAGLAAEGVEVVDVGVLPTPAVAYLAARRDVAAAVVSASHNPFPDNGVKLLGRGGRKLDDGTEAEIEAALARGAGARSEPPVGAAVGVVTSDPQAGRAWAERLLAALEGRSLAGLKVVVDCANGAASPWAGDIFARAGAEVTVINAAPDGTNINDGCGSTHPEGLAAEVALRGADLGLALDGDADRLVAVDHRGTVVDGDRLLALFAADLRSRGRLAGQTLVATVMSNLGLRLAMAEQGITVVETPVGDRHVVEAMEAGGFSLGGEQSGHIVFRDLATTGDGTLTGLLLCDLVLRAGRPLADLAAEAMTAVPQVLRNVRVATRRPDIAQAMADAIAAAESELGGGGRVLVRPSGTEPVVRVMVEAVDPAVAERLADRLAAEAGRRSLAG